MSKPPEPQPEATLTPPPEEKPDASVTEPIEAVEKEAEQLALPLPDPVEQELAIIRSMLTRRQPVRPAAEAPAQPTLQELCAALTGLVQRAEEAVLGTGVMPAGQPPVLTGDNALLRARLTFYDSTGQVFDHLVNIPLTGFASSTVLPMALRTLQAALSTLVLPPLVGAVTDYLKRNLDTSPTNPTMLHNRSMAAQALAGDEPADIEDGDMPTDEP